MMAFRRVMAETELWAGEMLGTCVDGRPVLLVNVDGKISAFEDRCRHQGVALSQGRLSGCVLVCKAHEWQYDAATGRGINPATARLVAFASKVEAGAIWVDVDVVEAS
jgi:toluene monooxygenase system ferredoxin subunit